MVVLGKGSKFYFPHIFLQGFFYSRVEVLVERSPKICIINNTNKDFNENSVDDKMLINNIMLKINNSLVIL